ncbi:2962_t:CDS:1 [Paraglomus brasilianum]|uniref:2962_t:CDS:1 n=1 Tax=Paraglomus brasilianum TaxID=144538 RepID=A0A9N8WEG1_9GLOM|nr:2962_t:CDS:1 [Paraglomus brasilianum]
MSHFQDAKNITIVENDLTTSVWQSGRQSITIDFRSILYLRVLFSVSSFEDSDFDYDNIDDQYGTCKFIEKDPETRLLSNESVEGSVVATNSKTKDGLANNSGYDGNSDKEDEGSEREDGRQRVNEQLENVSTRQAKRKRKKAGVQISEDASVVSRTSSMPHSLDDQMIPESISFLNVRDYHELCLLLKGIVNCTPKVPAVFHIEKKTPKSDILEHLQIYYDDMKQKDSRRNYFTSAFKYGSLVRYLSRHPELIDYEEQKMYLKTSYRLMKRQGKLSVRVYELFGILGEQSLKNVTANTMLYLEKITKPQFKQLIRFVKSAKKKGDSTRYEN